jgi:hypothetical protein
VSIGVSGRSVVFARRSRRARSLDRDVVQGHIVLQLRAPYVQLVRGGRLTSTQGTSRRRGSAHGPVTPSGDTARAEVVPTRKMDREITGGLLANGAEHQSFRGLSAR